MTDVQHTQPWLNHYPEGIDWSCELTRQPLNDYIDQAAVKFRDRPAIDFLGRKTTYGELAGQIQRAAEGFQKIGVRKGTRVSTEYALLGHLFFRCPTCRCDDCQLQPALRGTGIGIPDQR